jgi:spermidine synthase
LQDPRLEVFHQDGRFFIKRASRRSDFAAYESIIIYLGDPYTAQINRFYTREFFQEAKSCLTEEGVLSFGLSSSENFLNTEQEEFLASIYKTLKQVFREVKVIPGDTAYFLAADKPGLLNLDYRELIRRLKQRRIDTEFVREYYLFAKLSKERVQYLEERISRGKARLNTDFHPVSYYYDMMLWSTYFSSSWRNIFSRFNVKNIWALFSFVYLSILGFGFWRRRKTNFQSQAVLLAVSATGFTELSFQVLILLSFQIIYGYLYYKLGILLSSFMAGLVLGAWLMSNMLGRIKDDYGLFIKTQAAIFVYPLILPLILFVLHRASSFAFLNWLGSSIVFPALPIVAGFIGGLQFPLANKIILKDAHGIGRISGITYGMDLLGSCLGALLVSAFLVPILGIMQTCLAVAGLNFVLLLVLITNRKKWV